MFVLGRAVTGCGDSGLTAGVFVLLVKLMPLRKRPFFTSILGAIEGVSIISAPVLGGAITEGLSWRWCFYLNLPVGGLALLVTALFFKNPGASGGDGLTWKEKIQQLDLIGNLFFMPSITCLFIALSWAGVKYPWADPKVIGLLVAFSVLLVAFFYTEYRKGDAATLPLRILRQRSVMAGFLFIACTSGAMGVLVYYMPL
jgi:predicted MFS family arabinose efflux permease